MGIAVVAETARCLATATQNAGRSTREIMNDIAGPPLHRPPDPRSFLERVRDSLRRVFGPDPPGPSTFIRG